MTSKKSKEHTGHRAYWYDPHQKWQKSLTKHCDLKKTLKITQLSMNHESCESSLSSFSINQPSLSRKYCRTSWVHSTILRHLATYLPRFWHGSPKRKFFRQKPQFNALRKTMLQTMWKKWIADFRSSRWNRWVIKGYGYSPSSPCSTNCTFVQAQNHSLNPHPTSNLKGIFTTVMVPKYFIKSLHSM